MPGFTRTINWDKYQSKVTIQETNPYLDFLIDPSFQRVNRIFVLLFENMKDRKVYTKYCLPIVEINDYNLMVYGQMFFDQPVENNLGIYDNIQKILIGQGDDCTTGCLLDYIYFNNYYKMIAIDLSKQQAPDADPKVIQQINFTGNLEQNPVANTTMFFNIEEAKETILYFSPETVKGLCIYFYFNIISVQNDSI